MISILAQALISGITGGLVVGGLTLLAERAGERIGGLLGGLPSVVLVSYFFIGLTVGEEAVHASTATFPLAQVVTALSAWIYVVTEGPMARRLAMMMGFWAAAQGVVVASGIADFAVASFVYVVFLLAFTGFLLQRLHVYDLRGIDLARAKRSIGFLGRALIGGSVVALAVLLSKLAGPAFGAVMAAFPGVFLSSIIISEAGKGPNYTRRLMLSLIFSGLINCMAFIIVLRFTVIELGAVTATFVALSSTLGTVLATRMAFEMIAAHGRKPRA